MEHYYKNIQGWFEQTGLHKIAVNKYNNAHFVEIGCWKGRSTTHFGVEIINSGKNIRLDCVDTFKGSAEHNNVNKEKLYKEFSLNIEPIKTIIGSVHVMPSIEAAKLYADNSLDFVFIDASHDEKNVIADCSAWWPKVKIGGILSGDDYSDPKWRTVKNGVDKFFEKIQPVDTSFPPHWFVIKHK